MKISKFNKWFSKNVDTWDDTAANLENSVKKAWNEAIKNVLKIVKSNNKRSSQDVEDLITDLEEMILK